MKVFKISDEQLRSELEVLVKEHSVYGLKTGTEVEDMDANEIEFMRRISLHPGSRRNTSALRIVPLTVKIGGVEARTDIRMCLKLAVDCILAPMVESVYALDNFVSTARELCLETINREPAQGENRLDKYQPELAINIETTLACQNLDVMLFTEAAKWLSQITIGRGDLSKSMHLGINDTAVSALTKKILARIKHVGSRSSVGGGLSTGNIQEMAKEFPSDLFNTRHLVFINNENFRKDATMHLTAGLRFEQNLYQALAERYPKKHDSYLNRSVILELRIQEAGQT